MAWGDLLLGWVRYGVLLLALAAAAGLLALGDSGRLPPGLFDLPAALLLAFAASLLGLLGGALHRLARRGTRWTVPLAMGSGLLLGPALAIAGSALDQSLGLPVFHALLELAGAALSGLIVVVLARGSLAAPAPAARRRRVLLLLLAALLVCWPLSSGFNRMAIYMLAGHLGLIALVVGPAWFLARNRPATYLLFGNCMLLLGWHDSALAEFQRAQLL